MFEKILVSLDGSELAETAIPYAEELAEKLGAELHVVGVESPELHNVVAGWRQRANSSTSDAPQFGLEKYLSALRIRGANVKSALLAGQPAQEILTYADQHDIGLIVMATHGISGITIWPLGSVADKVTKAATQPVMLIRAKSHRTSVRKEPLKKILVSLDGSLVSEAVIPGVEILALKLRAEVVLCWVMEWPSNVASVDSTLPVTPCCSDKEIQELTENLTEYLTKVAARLRAKNITTRFEMTTGYPAARIIGLADEIEADLVAMATHGRSGIGGWALGSVAEKVLNAGNTPLLLVRPQDTAFKLSASAVSRK